MRTWRAGRTGIDGFDWTVSLLAAILTLLGPSNDVAAWLPRYAIVLLAAAQGLFLLARRHAPVAVLAATTALGAFMIAVGYPAGSKTAAACCAAYAVGAHPSSGVASDLTKTLRGAAASAFAAVAMVAAGFAPDARNPGAWNAFAVGVLVAASWVLGYAIQTRRAYVAELKDRAARLEAQEGERAARAVAEERLRIARELHDVIGHSISLITIQAEAATRSARTNPAATEGFLATISATSRSALTEMRHVLAVLRPDAQAELQPQPGLDALPELVARLEAGGLRTRLDAQPMDLPPGIELAIFRIVQESLTNVLKHAGAEASASVTVARAERAVRVSVHDDGVGPSKPVSGAAHGIVGMRERAAVYGGSLRTGARPGGGFEVEALIPLPEETPPQQKPPQEAPPKESV